jgi:hypothetical protein
MFVGANTSGDVAFAANQDLTGNIQFVLPVLADVRY